MPWIPELFSEPVLEQWLERRQQDRIVDVPFFDGLLADEPEALVGSFAGEPEVHHPVRGRIKGRRAFEAYVADTKAWVADRNVSVEPVRQVITDQRGFEEVILHVDDDSGGAALPLALVADHRSQGRLDEVRIYFSSWPLSGRHATRPPLLQPDPELRAPDVVAEHQRALADGDVEAIVATFDPDGHVREPAGGAIHGGPDGVRAFYAQLFSNDGGIPLEHCALVDDGRACALEYNVVRWGRTELPPEAGVAVYVRGPSGRLAAVRMYDDAQPPLGDSP